MELLQMSRLDMAILIVEGQPQWTNDGILLASYGPPFTREQYASAKLTIELSFGVKVHEAPSMTGTIDMIHGYVKWSRKVDHDSLLRRPKQKSEWGSANSQDFRVWFLQGVPGVGPKVAKAIDEALQGSPYTMRVEKSDLLQVDGVGDKTAEAIVKAVTPKKKRTRRTKP